MIRKLRAPSRNIRAVSVALAATAVAVVAGGSLAAFPAAAARPAASAARPSIEGVWMIRQQYYLGEPLSPKPDLSPAALAMRQRAAAAQAKGYVRSAANMLCLPTGGPQLFMYRSPFEIFEGFGRITFIFETEGSNQPRTVYMREKTQPADIYPSFNGHSIGHWEGRTLVVDTLGFNGRGTLLGPVPKSEKTHLTERISWSPDGKVMSIQLTAEDPVYLAKPWTTTLVFDRKPDSEERFEVWCEADLEAFKTLDLPSLKDADPEVARLLDPDLRPSDPALKFAPPTK
jgi:hypothetical protein